MLKINPKKTKIIVFQKGTKKFDYVFHIGNEMIDIIQDYASHLPEILHFHLKIFDKKPFMLFLV